MRDGQTNLQDKRARRPRRGAEDGATAVEFAMVMGPLFLMIFSILELALVFIVSTTLENAMNNASRRIRTGEFQATTGTMSESDVEKAFKTSVCEKMSFLNEHCKTSLSVDVRTLDQFNQGGAPDPVQADNSFNDEDLGVSAGGEGARMLARAFYRWPLATPFLEQALAKADGKAVISATSVFQNEPFGDGS